MKRTEEAERNGSRHFLDLVGSCLVIALLAGFFLVPDFRTQEFWRGQSGWLELFTPIGTVVAAGFAAWFAWKNYLLGQQKDIGDRFERGVVLLEAGSHAKRTAGIIVLEDLAIGEMEGRHTKWVREFLPAAVNEWNSDIVKGVASPHTDDLPQTPTFIDRGLVAIARTRQKEDPPRLYMPNLYVSNSGWVDRDFRRIVVYRGILNNAHFFSCELDDAILSGAFRTGVEFEDVNLRNGRVAISRGSAADVTFVHCDLSGTRITAQRGVEVILENCKVDRTVVSGNGEIRFEECWFDESPPQVRNVFAARGRLGIYRADKRTRVKPGKVPLWKRSDEDEEVAKSVVASGQILRSAERADRNEAAIVETEPLE